MRSAFYILSAAITGISLFTMSTANTSAASTHTEQSNYLLYVGTYGKGVYAYRYETAGLKLQPLGLVGEVVNPSFLATDRDYKYLFAVSELEGKVNGGVASFAIDRNTGSLQLLNTRPSGGEAPCHLAVDHTTKMLLVANYGTGGVSAFPIARDGRLDEMSALMTAEGSSVNRERQEGPHAHEVVISTDNRRAYVPDLGLDRIRIYHLDPNRASLAPNDPPYATEQPGRGPRHLAFSPNEKFAYVANELKSFVAVYRRDPASGDLKEIQSVSTLPAGFSGDNAPAEIQVDRAGKYVYVSNRGPGTIAVFAIDPASGTLREVQIAETGGTWPRGFEIDPMGRYLFAGDQKANSFVVFSIDSQTGRLTLTGQKLDVPSPVSFQFVPSK